MHNRRCSVSVCAVAPDKMPWGTHAYIVSSRQAERMALTVDMMIERSKRPVDDFHTTSWQLDGEDLKIDHYLSMYYTDLTPQDDKRRCEAPSCLPKLEAEPGLQSEYDSRSLQAD